MTPTFLLTTISIIFLVVSASTESNVTAPPDPTEATSPPASPKATTAPPDPTKATSPPASPEATTAPPDPTKATSPPASPEATTAPPDPTKATSPPASPEATTAPPDPTKATGSPASPEATAAPPDQTKTSGSPASPEATTAPPDQTKTTSHPTTPVAATSTASSGQSTISSITGGSTTPSPGTSNTTTNGTTEVIPQSSIAVTTATTTPGPCSPSPCRGDSTCEERFGGTFVCVCRPGLVYINQTGCTQAKVFPGTLTIDGEFEDAMSNTASEKFRNIADSIEKQLRDSLQRENYLNSVVLRLRAGSIIAEIQNIYDIAAEVTGQSVSNQIAEAITKGDITATTFTGSSLCSYPTCDNVTTDCTEPNDDGLVKCTCKKEYVQSLSTDRACLACPSGKKAVESKTCENCPFGYTGFNCNDPYLLVVVVVSCVLGALLIIFMVALIVVSLRRSKGTSTNDDFNGYGKVEIHKPAGVLRIPRANPNSGWDANNVEMTNNGSTNLLTKGHPEKTRQCENVRTRSQAPTSYSNYSGTENGSRGTENPYFQQDDERPRRY